MENIFDFLNGEQEKKQTIDFIKFSREWITSTTIKGAPNYTTAVNALVRFIGKEELNINLITLDFLESFKVFLNKEREVRTKKLILQGKRVPSNRSLSLYLVSIKKLFNEAKKKYNKKRKTSFLYPILLLLILKFLSKKQQERELYQQTSLKRCGNCLIKHEERI